MENHTAQTRQKQTAKHGGLLEWRRIPSKTLEHVSPMRLLDLLWKTDQDHHNLSPTEKSTLAVLITYVYRPGIAVKGYESYPAGDLLKARTGYGMRTIEANRRTLREKGWIKVQAGRGRGNANHYFINGRKIVEAYNLSHPNSRIEAQGGDAYSAVKEIKSSVVRNTNGLRRGSSPIGPIGPVAASTMQQI